MITFALRVILIVCLAFPLVQTAAAQSDGQSLAAQYAGRLVVIRAGGANDPITTLYTAAASAQDRQIISQNFALAGVTFGQIALLNTATINNDLQRPGSAFIVQANNLSNPLLAGLFRPGLRVFVFAENVGLTKAAIRRPDGTQLTRDGTPRVLDRQNRNVLVSAGDPADGLQTVLYTQGAPIGQVRAILQQAGITTNDIRLADNISLSLLSEPGTALLNGEVMFLDPQADFVLQYAPTMGVYYIENRVFFEDITPASLITDTVAEAQTEEVIQSTIQQAPEKEPISQPETETVIHLAFDSSVVPDGPVLLPDEQLLDGYLFVFGTYKDAVYLRPGFCETGVVEGLVVQHVPSASTDWRDYVGMARSALVSTQYWDKDNCAGRKTLDVNLTYTFDGVTHTQFSATIAKANKISGAEVTQLAPLPPATPFSEALSAIQMENYLVRLPDNWVPGSPPGLSSQADARYPHALYVEGLAAKADLYEWTEESLNLFQSASALGHRGATEQLLEHVDFAQVVSKVFFNLSQGNPPIEQNMRDVMASHGALYEVAVAQGMGKYVTLQKKFEDYNYNLADGVIELNKDAPPNHYDLTRALNAQAKNVLNPLSKAYIAGLGLQSQAGWECDGTWCVALGGLSKFRMLARPNGLDCVLTSDTQARCAFNIVHVFRGHEALQGTAQNQVFELMMAPARAVPRRAEVELIRSNDSWSIVGLIQLQD